MKKLFVIICFVFLCLPALARKDYYIKTDKDYNLEFLCFNENECYNSTPDEIKIKNKRFVGFSGFHYFDASTYKYDKSTDTHTVDVMVDRDPSTDLRICNKCPYDRGNITHLIFSLSYTPSKKKFKATYKGFISSEDMMSYKGGYQYITVHYLNYYYDKNQKLIADLDEWLEFLNKKMPQRFGTRESSNYDIEIEYIIPRYLR